MAWLLGVPMNKAVVTTVKIRQNKTTECRMMDLLLGGSGVGRIIDLLLLAANSIQYLEGTSANCAARLRLQPNDQVARPGQYRHAVASGEPYVTCSS